jgi:hypothetical protein
VHDVAVALDHEALGLSSFCRGAVHYYYRWDHKSIV